MQVGIQAVQYREEGSLHLPHFAEGNSQCITYIGWDGVS